MSPPRLFRSHQALPNTNPRALGATATRKFQKIAQETQTARLALRKSRQICCVTSSLPLRKAPEMVDLKWRDRMV